MEDTISIKIQELLAEIQNSEEYRNYRIQEVNLEAQKELWDRVDAFRANNFRLQNDPSKEDLFERAEKLAVESAELRKIPDVNAYLDAELAMGKMLQRICKTLINGVDIRVPEF